MSEKQRRKWTARGKIGSWYVDIYEGRTKIDSIPKLILVHMENLVLYDFEMNIQTPTHELTRAHAVLRVPRRIASAEPDWALTSSGLCGVR